jgi:uncharacterized protein YsxB (DUF464 family)
LYATQQVLHAKSSIENSLFSKVARRLTMEEEKTEKRVLLLKCLDFGIEALSYSYQNTLNS